MPLSTAIKAFEVSLVPAAGPAEQKLLLTDPMMKDSSAALLSVKTALTGNTATGLVRMVAPYRIGAGHLHPTPRN
jgi:hypothetical protein